MTKLLVLFTLVAAGATASHRTEIQPPLAHFRIVWERSDSGLWAQCSDGCLWKELTFACRAGCQPLIDANGLNSDSMAKAQPSAFAFRVHPTLDGLRAESVRRTAWQALSYGCRSLPCRARMDERGIYGLGFN